MIAACRQTQVYVGQGQRRGVERLHRHLTVEQRQVRHHLHLIEQLPWVERGVVTHRQPLHGPAALLVLLDRELQTVHFKMRDAHLTRQQACPEIGNNPHTIQTQSTGALADHDVVGQQYRGKPAPAAFQAANAQRHAQCAAGSGFYIDAVFGNQRRQLTAEADVQRREHQNQRAEAQAPAGQGCNGTRKTPHLRMPSAAGCKDRNRRIYSGSSVQLRSGPGFARLPHIILDKTAYLPETRWALVITFHRLSSFRAAPRRIVPASTWFLPENGWSGQ